MEYLEFFEQYSRMQEQILPFCWKNVNQNDKKIVHHVGLIPTDI